MSTVFSVTRPKAQLPAAQSKRAELCQPLETRREEAPEKHLCCGWQRCDWPANAHGKDSRRLHVNIQQFSLLASRGPAVSPTALPKRLLRRDSQISKHTKSKGFGCRERCTGIGPRTGLCSCLGWRTSWGLLGSAKGSAFWKCRHSLR